MEPVDIITKHFEETISIKEKLLNDPSMMVKLEQAAAIISNSIQNGGKLLLAGNGGSASDAEHISGEFLGRLVHDRQPLPSLALSSESPTLTAIANDYGYEEVFARQVRGLGKEGDVFLGISTSGKSKNILNAMKEASHQSMSTIFLTGQLAGGTRNIADIELNVPSQQTMYIQEAHIMLGHVLCQLVENYLFSFKNWVK